MRRAAVLRLGGNCSSCRCARLQWRGWERQPLSSWSRLARYLGQALCQQCICHSASDS